MGVKLSDIPLLTNPPDGSTLVGIHNGTPVRFPKNAVGGGVTEEGAISISTVKGLTAYVVNCTATTYMSSIKEAIESAGGDVTRLNLVSLQGSGRGELILINMIQSGSTSYQIRCIELNKLWSYYGYKDLTTTLISDFLNLTDSSNYDSRLEDLEGDITGKMNSYTFNVTSVETTLKELITSIKAQGYTSNDPLILKLTGYVQGVFVGYINSWAGDTLATFELNKAGTTVFYKREDIRSTTPINTALNTPYGIDLHVEIDNLTDRITDLEEGGSSEGETSGGVTLSMPRIRAVNWYYTEIPAYDDPNTVFVSGRLVFSVNVQDGTVQEGDQLQVCALRNTFGKYKLRPILSRAITSEDIENLTKQPYLQISTDNFSGNAIASNQFEALRSLSYTDSNSSFRRKPKYIRIRRPIYQEGGGEPVNALFSNVVPVEMRLRWTTG